MNTFDKTIERDFHGTLPDDRYVQQSASLLRSRGFSADNAIACVATCRDEICRPVRELIHDEWGESFNFSSLAGMPTLGRTGFQPSTPTRHAPTSGAGMFTTQCLTWALEPTARLVSRPGVVFQRAPMPVVRSSLAPQQ